jgi:type IV pilus assembly protein PilY1
MNVKLLVRTCAMALVTLTPVAAWPQLVIQDNFTSGSSAFNWQTFNGACLTAGNNSGNIPACYGLPYYGGEQLVGGSTGLLPDPAGSGALRFTNGRPGGYNQSGAIVSNFTFPTSSGLHVTFATATYRGDSGGAGGDGADGISFYLMDGSKPAGIGAFGGSLAYTCSNANTPHDGLIGGYLGLGIDEFGNFLNGATLEPGYIGSNIATGDNTALGYGYHPGRIGLRGAGSIAFSALNALNSAFYPATLTAAKQQEAVMNTCTTGVLWNYSTPANPVPTTTAVADYAPILNAYKELPAGFLIANEGAATRGAATPITYDLKITPAGLLSLSYSYNGGANQLVINGQDITASNGALPSTFRFGFAGSTGGDTNIHEILCFKATPFEQSSSSAGLNQQQAAQVNTGTQVYLAFFDPSNWSGSLTAQNVLFNSSNQTVSISSVANWDASCVLTGVAAGRTCAATGVSGATAAQTPSSRVMMTWNGSQGIPFEWASLTGAQQNTLDAGDPNPHNANRLNYLRGDRSNEQNALGVGMFGARVSVLSDIVDSSPTPVGPPNIRYPATWSDFLISAPSLPENAGQSYPSYATARSGRLNIVYVGANDGFLHGFRSGSFDSSGNFISTGATPNDGREIMAYMPGAVLNTIHDPTNPALDFSNIQYGHNFYVDATPGNGDLFYGGLWHTWLVGGLGPGGSAIYALDVTSGTFSEAGAASAVVGEWNPTTLTCTNVAGCGNNLGNTYGTPQIRRFHNGMWGAIFGNGYGSASGDAGIYVMTVNPASGARTFYYFGTGKAGSSDGIAYPAPADIDGDHIVDYVYAGDLLGNLWRFDLTSSNPANWAVTSTTPMFKTPAGQPITTQVVPLVTTQTTSLPRVIVDFGTGRQIPLTNASPTTYATGAQALYGIWDWNMSSWNLIAAQKFASMPSPQSVTIATLSAQAVLSTVTSSGGNIFRTITSNPVCWAGSATCSSGANNQFGWTLPLPSTAEQIIFNPTLQLGVFLVNSTVPPSTDPYQCLATTTSGWTYGISPSNGGTFTTSTFGDSVNSFTTYNNQVVGAENTNGTGSTSVVLAGGHSFLVMQTSAPGSSGGTTSSGGGSSSGSSGGGSPGTALPFNGPNPHSTRVTWVERR